MMYILSTITSSRPSVLGAEGAVKVRQILAISLYFFIIYAICIIILNMLTAPLML